MNTNEWKLVIHVSKHQWLEISNSNAPVPEISKTNASMREKIVVMHQCVKFIIMHQWGEISNNKASLMENL